MCLSVLHGRTYLNTLTTSHPKVRMSGEHEDNGVEGQNGAVSERPPTNWVDYAEDRYFLFV